MLTLKAHEPTPALSRRHDPMPPSVLSGSPVLLPSSLPAGRAWTAEETSGSLGGSSATATPPAPGAASSARWAVRGRGGAGCREDGSLCP
eukprot:112224-Hanusia_phi.AAC.3